MPSIASALERAKAPRRSDESDMMRRALRLLLVALDRLVRPPHEIADDEELPDGWFKYPPI